MLASALLMLPLLVPQQAKETSVALPAAYGESIVYRWSELEPVDQSPVTRENPADLAVDALGGRHLIFGGHTNEDCDPETYWCGLYHQFSADGETWTTPSLVPGTFYASSFEEPVAEADETGRVYLAWVGRGVELCWTDDQGETYSPPVRVSGDLPAGGKIDLQIDPYGAVHVAWLGLEVLDPWTWWWDVYYAWSTPTYLGGPGSWRARDPIFHPGYPVSTDHFAGGDDVTLAVGPGQWVTVAWQNWDGFLRIAQARAGEPFPPPGDPGTGKVVWHPWAVVDEDGVVTIIYHRYGPPDYDGREYSLIAMDGRTFEGPFPLTPPDDSDTHSPRRCVHAGRPGEIHLLWVGFLGNEAGYWHSVSYDHGRSLAVHTLLWDNQDYPPSGYGSLDLLPDGRPAQICYIHRYGEALSFH
ncbi:MAG: hypothetical protein AB1486_26195 [Planctomycetota bacterium]